LVYAALRQVQRFGLGTLGLVLGNGAGLHHRISTMARRFQRAVGMPVGIQPAGALDEARQQRAFRQAELVHVFREVACDASPNPLMAKLPSCPWEPDWHTSRRSASW